MTATRYETVTSMKRFAFILPALLSLCILSGKCQSRMSYDDTLSQRIGQLENLSFYDNGVVMYADSVDYDDLSFPYWKSESTYYQDDIVRYAYCQYRALPYSTMAQPPDKNPRAWALIRGPHPFLFLRDTARLGDLMKLLSHDHPYVRVYTFAALCFRHTDHLYPYILDNLTDTTQVLEYRGDTATPAYVADIMIEYAATMLTTREKKRLTELITFSYKYLNRGLLALRRELKANGDE